MFKLNGFAKKVFITATSFGLLMAFQNCSPTKSSVRATSSEMQKSTSANVDDQVSTAPTLIDNDISKEDTADMQKEDGCNMNDGDMADQEIAAYYIKKCEMEIARGQTAIAAGGSIIGDRGATAFSISTLKEASNLRGNQVFVGSTASSSIDRLSDSRGYTLVCGADIKEASNIRGSLIVVKGNVGILKDVRGRVRVIEGTIGTMSDVRGNVRAY